MKQYRVTIAEAISYKQFVCEISANSAEEARKSAKDEFNFQYPNYKYHSKVIMVSEILNV